MIYAIFLWILGILILLNIFLIMDNMYFPKYYPVVSLLLALIYLTGLILISVWMCNNTESTRSFLVLSGWLIFGATISIILWNIYFISNYNKKEKNAKVHVGTGDNSEDYDDQSKTEYILGYVLWGIVILTLDILFICVAMSYVKSFEQSPFEEDKKPMEKEPEKEKDMEADKPGDAAEGGMLERQSAASRASSSRKSQAIRSQPKPVSGRASATSSQKAASPAPAPAAEPTISHNNEQEAVRLLATQQIEVDETPRHSLTEQIPYEHDKSTTSVQFNEEVEQPQAIPAAAPSQKKKSQSKKKRGNKQR